MKNAEDEELEEAADWIYRNAFAMPTISHQVKAKSRGVLFENLMLALLFAECLWCAWHFREHSVRGRSLV